MSILLDLFGFTVMFIIQPAVLLSVLTGVSYGGCMCPILISVFLIGGESCMFVYNLPHSSFAADVITAFITLSKMNIGPLKSLPYLLPK